MAHKVHVIDDRARPTGEKLKRTVAALLIRRLLADWVVYNVSIRRRTIAEVNLAQLPREQVARPCRRPAVYQHHIEPKIIPLGLENSEWMRYLEGYSSAISL